MLWMQDRYHVVHEIVSTSELRSPYQSWLAALLGLGYVVALVDTRGSGASFGSQPAPFGEIERRDAHDVTEWLARQPFSTGRVGMIGRSYSAIAQYMATSVPAPGLAGVYAEMGMADLYGFAHSGGIFRHDFAESWARRVRELDHLDDAISVDEDADRGLLRAAQREHADNGDVYDIFSALPYRDSCRAGDTASPYESRSPFEQRAAIRAAGVPICHHAGWLDMWVRDAAIWYRNLDNPQSLVIGPWSHGAGIGEELAHTQDAWFRPLFGRDAIRPARREVRFARMGARSGLEWRSGEHWPPDGVVSYRLYLTAGPSRTIQSQYDGGLTPVPDTSGGEDRFIVDYAASSGRTSRWSNGYGAEFRYGDMAENDRRGVTYTSPPLARAVEIAGHPIARVWLRSAVPDADLFAYLERVWPDGMSEYLTEGCLRASHRRLTPRPEFAQLGLPYHRSEARDLVTGLDPAVELAFDLLPLAAVIEAGERIRVTLTGADADNALTTRRSPPPVLFIQRAARFPSSIELPVIGPEPTFVPR